eukprot:gene3174-biopygen3660
MPEMPANRRACRAQMQIPGIYAGVGHAGNMPQNAGHSLGMPAFMPKHFLPRAIPNAKGQRQPNRRGGGDVRPQFDHRRAQRVEQLLLHPAIWRGEWHGPAK